MPVAGHGEFFDACVVGGVAGLRLTHGGGVDMSSCWTNPYTARPPVRLPPSTLRAHRASPTPPSCVLCDVCAHHRCLPRAAVADLPTTHCPGSSGTVLCTALSPGSFVSCPMTWCLGRSSRNACLRTARTARWTWQVRAPTCVAGFLHRGPEVTSHGLLAAGCPLKDLVQLVHKDRRTATVSYARVMRSVRLLQDEGDIIEVDTDVYALAPELDL